METKKKIKEWQCDGGGENKTLPDKLIKENQSINFGFTPQDTLQFNGVIERVFAMLYGRIRAMLNRAKLPQDMRDKLWAKVANTATKLNIIVSHEKGKDCPYKLVYLKLSKYVKNLCVFGKLGSLPLAAIK